VIIWQVTSRSCEMGVPLTAIHCFTLIIIIVVVLLFYYLIFSTRTARVVLFPINQIEICSVPNTARTHVHCK